MGGGWSSAHYLYRLLFTESGKMKILGKLPARVVVHASALEMVFTILLCHGLAVGCGHVKAWLPMISDCAVLAPEKYPFRLGFVVGAVLIAVQAVVISYADGSPARSKVSLALGAVSAFCLAVVGVVNEDECNPVHSGRVCLHVLCYCKAESHLSEIVLIFLCRGSCHILCAV